MAGQGLSPCRKEGRFARALRISARIGLGLALTACVALGFAPSGEAQTSGLGGDISGILQQMQNNGTQGITAPSSTRQPQSQTIQAPSGPPPVTTPSRIELVMSKRAGLPLRQFGYDVFTGMNQITVPQVGSVQGYYVLGPGDQLHISLRGQENAAYDVYVGNDGNVTLPKLPPVRAAGRTFSDFQASLEAAVKQAYISTSVYVSVGQFRQINVTVAGEVNAPGVKQLTGMSSPLDALILALGVKNSGSLRNIKILRGGRTIPFDLYRTLLVDSTARPVLLTDGDRIVVPPVGKVVAASGWVGRPGIFELAPGQDRMPLSELLRLAGGLQVRGAYRYSLLTTGAGGARAMDALTSLKGEYAKDGDILFVEQAVSTEEGSFQLLGPTSLAGFYSLSKYSTLADLLRSPGAMGQSPYMLLGVISRMDPRTLQRKVVGFSPTEIRDGRANITLQSRDIVRVFSRSEFDQLVNAVNIYSARLDYLDVVNQPGMLGSAAEISAHAQQQAVNAAIYASVVPGGGLNPYWPGMSQYATNMANPAFAGTMTPNGMQGGAVSGQNPNLPLQQQGQYPGVVPGATQNPYAAGQGAMGAAAQPYGTTTGQVPGQIPQQTYPQLYQQNPYYGAQGTAYPTTGYQGAAGYPNATGYSSYLQRMGVNGVPAPGAPGYSQYLYDQRQIALQQQNDQIQQAISGPFALDQRMSSEGNIPVNAEIVNVAQLSSQIGVAPDVMISFLADHRVTLSGAVRGPGTFLVGGPVALEDLVESAGGPEKWTDMSRVDLQRTLVNTKTGQSKTTQSTIALDGTKLASVEVLPRDTFRFDPVYTDADQGTVAVQGEVRFPGNFSLVRGQRLSELLKQAGGLTPQAYPYGAVFLRKSAAQVQQDGYERAAEDIQKQLMMAVAQGSTSNTGAPNADAAAFLQGLVQQLHNTRASGRVTVVADPAVLATKPEDDVVLQPGDFLYIPQRPSDVTVVGEVLNPGSYPQKPNMNVEDYISQAGGYGRYADDGYVFIVNPDGSSRQMDAGLFHFNSDQLAPGSLIVVPRNLRPTEFQQLTLLVSKVFSDLAVAAASLSVVSR